MPDHVDPAPLPGPRREMSLRTTCWVVLMIATFLGLFFAAQMYFSAASFGHKISWGQALYWSFGDWYEWALLSPVIFWLCRRLRFGRTLWLRSLAGHLLCGLSLAVAHAALCALAAIFQGWVTA